MFRLIFTICSLLLFLVVSSAAAQDKTQKITYQEHVKPILVQRCSSCHGGGKKEGDLDITNYTNLMLGGGSGEVISPGSASDSYLYGLITHEDSPEMPPNGKIPDAEIKIIASWIDAGALENAGSKPRKSKPKMDLSMDADASKRPEHVAVPLKMPLEPVIQTERPSATAIATSPWAPLAAIAAPKQILLYNTKSLELIGVLPFDEGIAHSLKFSRNGSLLLAGGGKDGQSGTTILFDVTTGQRLTSIGDELDTVLAADISANQQLIALGGPKKLVKIFNVADEQLVFEFSKHTDWITAVEFSPDNQFLATGDRNGGLHVWEVTTGNEIFTLNGHKGVITGISWRADSKIVATASEDGSVKTWELKNGKQVKSWGAHGGGVTSIEFRRDGQLVTSGRDKLAKLWQQDGKQIRQFQGLIDITIAVSYCDETQRIICTDWTGKILVWNAADGKPAGTLEANPPTVAHRLELAEAAVHAAKQKYEPLAAHAEQAAQKLHQLNDSVDQKKQLHADLQTAVAELETQIASQREKLKSLNQQRKQWNENKQRELAARKSAEQAHAQAIEASKANPDDESFQKKVAETDSAKNAIDASIEALANSRKKLAVDFQTVQAELNRFVETMKSERPKLNDLSKQLAQLESQVPPAEKAAEESAAAAAAAKSELDKAESRVHRWQEHLEFIKQLAAMTEQLAAAHQVVAEKQEVVDQQQKKVIEAQAHLDAAAKIRQQVEAQANAIEQEMLELRKN